MKQPLFILSGILITVVQLTTIMIKINVNIHL